MGTIHKETDTEWEIRRMYEAGGVSAAMLARQFGLPLEEVKLIVNRHHIPLGRNIAGLDLGRWEDFTPQFDRVVLSPLETLPGLIELVEEGEPDRGEVVMTGPGYPRGDGAFDPLAVKPGDHVLYDFRRVQASLKIDGRPCVMVNEEDILARLEPREKAKGKSKKAKG